MAAETLFQDTITYVHGLAKSALADEGVPVTIGGTTVNRPSEFIVREVVQNVSVSDRSTSTPVMGKARGCWRLSFSVACEAWSTKADLETAAFDVQRWYLLLMRAVAADKTLGGLVIHAEPYMSEAGTAKDADGRRYIADITFGINVKAELDPAATE